MLWPKKANGLFKCGSKAGANWFLVSAWAIAPTRGFSRENGADFIWVPRPGSSIEQTSTVLGRPSDHVRKIIELPPAYGKQNKRTKAWGLGLVYVSQELNVCVVVIFSCRNCTFFRVPLRRSKLRTVATTKEDCHKSFILFPTRRLKKNLESRNQNEDTFYKTLLLARSP